jgi:restriction-modification enzyme MmeI-like protein
MNAVEIEEAISALAEQPFDSSEFPFAFLQAFGNKDTTIKRLRADASNKSDLNRPYSECSTQRACTSQHCRRLDAIGDVRLRI